MNAKHPDYSGMGHIDPGDPPRETYHPNGPDAGIPYGGDLQNVPEAERPTRYPDDINCHTSSAKLEQHTSQAPPYRNPDPINRPGPWQPGPKSWDADAEREAHFRPDGGASLGQRNPHDMHIHIDKSSVLVRPEREGPDYGKAGVEESDEDPNIRIDLSIAMSAVPRRTKWILQNVVPTALRSFIRHNLQYRDADESLGLQGQFAEMSHILAKLKRQIWDRRNPESVATGEIQEQLESLIGHALLALDHLDKGNKDGR